jgi:DeoR/GlpR family transcriptional regulator of sugar metabolism
MKLRHMQLVETVSQYGRIEVNELAYLLHTSNVTIRKDLDYLSQKGILRRERGYALLKSKEDINYRMAFHFKEKQKIARAAAELVSDGEVIMVESGSTCAMFAEQLLQIRKGITIVTNSAYIASYIKETPDVGIVLLGGIDQKNTQAMVGPLTKECARLFSVDKIFVGTDGFTQEFGFMGEDLLRADTLQTLVQSANHTYVLTESQKFEVKGAVPFLKTEQVYELITDCNLAEPTRQYLEEKHVMVTMV